MNISSANLPVNEINFQNLLDCSQRGAHTSHVTLKHAWRPLQGGHRLSGPLEKGKRALKWSEKGSGKWKNAGPKEIRVGNPPVLPLFGTTRTKVFAHVLAWHVHIKFIKDMTCTLRWIIETRKCRGHLRDDKI